MARATEERRVRRRTAVRAANQGLGKALEGAGADRERAGLALAPQVQTRPWWARTASAPRAPGAARAAAPAAYCCATRQASCWVRPPVAGRHAPSTCPRPRRYRLTDRRALASGGRMNESIGSNESRVPTSCAQLCHTQLCTQASTTILSTTSTVVVLVEQRVVVGTCTSKYMKYYGFNLAYILV